MVATGEGARNKVFIESEFLCNLYWIVVDFLSDVSCRMEKLSRTV